MTIKLDQQTEDDATSRLATALGVAANDMRAATKMSNGLPAAGTSNADVGARLLLCLGALRAQYPSAEAATQLGAMTFQLEHGEQAHPNWIGQREANRPFKDSFAEQLTHLLEGAAAKEIDARLTIGWGSAGYGEIELPVEQTNFLYSTRTLIHEPIRPGIVRLTSIEVDWTRKLVVEKDALARYARVLNSLTQTAEHGDHDAPRKTTSMRGTTGGSGACLRRDRFRQRHAQGLAQDD